MKRELDDERLPLSRTPPVAEDVRRELAFHFEQRIAELMQRGIPREQAEAEARASFGDAARVEAECRAIERRRRATVRRTERLGALWQDLLVGQRVLRKNPGFTLTAVLTLGLGTGAVAAMFSIVSRVLLRPLPYEDPDRLVAIEQRIEQGTASVPWANFLDLEARSRSFAAMTSYGAWAATVVGTGTPLRVRNATVSAGFFRVFSLRPVLGRLPAAEDHRLGAAPVAVVSYELWRSALGAPASLEHVRLKLGYDFQVIGVLPPGFEYPDHIQIWWPMELMDQSKSRTSHNWEVVGRLKPKLTAPAAERELAGILAALNPFHYPDFHATGAVVTGLQQAETATLQKPLWLLLAASGVFLLAACTNLASGLLARGTARLGELTVRSALGATRLRLARQLLTESVMLAVMGALAGLLLAAGLLKLFTPLAPATLRMDLVRVDGWVIVAALGITIATTLGFGLIPALRLSNVSTVTELREAAVGMASMRKMRAWNILVAAEVALAVALLAGSVLLIKSFQRVMAIEQGFDATGALALSVDLPSANYPGNSPRGAQFHTELLARLGALPGVQAVGFTNVLPLESGGPSGSLHIEGKPLDPKGPFNAYAVYRVIGGDYFKAMGMAVLQGRGLGPGDDETAPRVVVIDEAFANQEWPGQDPLGKRLRPSGMDAAGDTEPWFTVVGVVRSVRASSLTGALKPTYYFDYRQRPPYRTNAVIYAIRTLLPEASAAPAFRGAIRSLDPEVPGLLRSMPEVVAGRVADKRFTMLMLSSFGGLALLLALVGIYGVVSYAVAQRTREIGVRRALGASPRRLKAMVLAGTLRAILPGLAAGLVLALAAGRALGALLYGVRPFDPATLGAALGALGLAGIVASLVPAWRAARVDPLRAMRSE